MDGDGRTVRLSARELAALRMIAEGHTIDGIARAWGVAPCTVASFRKRLYVKLGVNCAPAAVAEGYRRGWLGDVAA